MTDELNNKDELKNEKFEEFEMPKQAPELEQLDKSLDEFDDIKKKSAEDFLIG